MGPTDADFRRFSNFFAIFAKHAKYTILHSTQYQSKERGRSTLPGRGSHFNFHEIQLKNAPGANFELAKKYATERAGWHPGFAKKSKTFGQVLSWSESEFWPAHTPAENRLSYPQWGGKARDTGESTTFCELKMYAKKTHMIFLRIR